MINCTICGSFRHSSYNCETNRVGDPHPEGVGKVTFTRLDGGKVVIDNVIVDSVSPIAETPGVIGVDLFHNDRVIHVPFVSHWEFDYRM